MCLSKPENVILKLLLYTEKKSIQKPYFDITYDGGAW